MISVDEVLILWNPAAGHRKSKSSLASIVDVFTSRGIKTRVLSVRDGEEVEKAIRETGEKGSGAVFIVGGDGTINSIARKIAGTHTGIGIIPAGSGNGLAGHLGIVKGRARLEKLVDEGRFIEMDCGSVNGTLFFTTSGVGFDAEVGYIFSIGNCRGFIGYATAFIKGLFGFKPVEAVIELPSGTMKSKAFALTFANADQYGNSARIAPEADVEDGKINLVVVRQFPFHAIPGLLIRLFTGTIHRSRFVETLLTERAVVKLNRPGHLHFDGEASSHSGTLEFKMNRGKVRILVPPSYLEKRSVKG